MKGLFYKLTPKEEKLTSHYYGDMVRVLFMLAAVVVILTTPLISSFLPINVFILIVFVLVLALIAGLTNPAQKWTVATDVGISLLGVAVFEYFAVSAFLNVGLFDPAFSITQLLAVIFLFTLYYSTKSLRGMYLRDKE
ncbi:hypothetical protein HY382_00895, partial [Candidatus Curtissbacteria bacterium]|nr:hypothetical protein [Candidatus Curtissbacteria bacterium]